MIIKNIMKKALVIDKDILLKKAASIMSSEDITSLIFIKNNKLKGIITHEDLVENFGKNEKVSKIMSKNVITIQQNKKISKAIELMKRNKIGVLPVIDRKNDLVGVIDAKDLLLKACDAGDFLIE